MKTHAKTLLTALATCTAVAAGSANAATIAVANASFESGTTNWTNGGSGGYNTRSTVSGINPTDGSLQMWVNNGALIYQDTGEVIAAGMTYELTIDWNPDQAPFPNQETVVIRLYGSAAGFGTALGTAEATLLGPADNSGDNSIWTTSSVSFTATGAEAGQTLGVAFGVTGGTQSEWDNVRLTAVPEPGSLALLGLGGLLVVRRRRSA